MAKQEIVVDEQGRLIFPPDLIKKYGITPGDNLFLEEGRDRMLLNSSVSRLARIYVEPTSRCNLECATCIRNAWDEPLGNMELSLYDKILHTLDISDPVPEVFFGGFGEPLSHPHIIHMIKEAKNRGAHVELITNGILLDQKMAKTLIELKLDRIWVSIDGATPESYSDVRMGNEFARIKQNLLNLKHLKTGYQHNSPSLGITFVAMKRNIQDLPEIARLLNQLGADTLHVSNVLPHTKEMKEEILYEKSITKWANGGESIIFPRMDLNDEMWTEIKDLFLKFDMQDLAGDEFLKPRDTCAFIEKGSLSIRFDGKISPCLPLLHSNTNYLKDNLRTTKASFFGDLKDSDLLHIWNDREYKDFRTRVMKFDFSPCTSCSSCEMSESNEEDCFGSAPFSCGGCLWAQGYIQCP